MLPDDIENIIKQTQIENWYEDLKGYTMATQFCSLSEDEQRLIIQQYENYRTSDNSSFSILPELEVFRTKLDFLISENFTGGGFVRLSTRSPKDSKFAEEKGEKYLEEFDIKDLTENQKTIIQMQAHKDALRVMNGKEALELLCTSERVYDDLIECIEQANDVQLVLREWKEIKLEHEFRGFIYDNNLTALTQYFHYCYFPDLPTIKDRTQKKVCDLFVEIRDLVNLDSYVLDIVVTEDECYLVEINPFIFGAAEPGLFSWKTDLDLLQNGPFEFRIRETPLS